MGFLFKRKPYTDHIIQKYSFFFICLFSSTTLIADRLHVLKKGETLYSLSQQYATPLPLILERNHISDARKIIAGQKIYIPNVHTVQKGDTLYSIAKKYAVSVTDLAKSNKLTTNHVLKIGINLIIPSFAVPKAAPAQGNKKTIQTHDPQSYAQKKSDSTILWPVRATSISYLSGKLYGVAIDSYTNEPVRSITSGCIISKGSHRVYGTVVFIQSKTKHVYIYGGLKETHVQTGQNVKLGEKIGTLTESALANTPRLYFMVYKNNKPLDPTRAPRGY